MILLETDLKGKGAEEIYASYKSRWSIETYYNRLKNGIDFEALNLLSEYFEVSFEYLLGNSDKEDAKPSQEELDFYALSEKADEIKESTELLCRLSDKSRKIVEELIASIYRTENRDGELCDEALEVEIRVKV